MADAPLEAEVATRRVSLGSRSSRQRSLSLPLEGRQRLKGIDSELARLSSEREEQKLRVVRAQASLQHARELELAERQDWRFRLATQEHHHEVVIRMQALVRGWLGRRKLMRLIRDRIEQNLQNEHYKSILPEQLIAMQHDTHRLKYTELHRMAAAVKLQAWWRMLLTRRVILVLIAARGVDMLREYMNTMATKVQSKFRFWRARKTFLHMIWEKVLVRRAKQKHEMETAYRCIVQIQRSFRAKLAYKTMSHERSRRTVVAPNVEDMCAVRSGKSLKKGASANLSTSLYPGRTMITSSDGYDTDGFLVKRKFSDQDDRIIFKRCQSDTPSTARASTATPDGRDAYDTRRPSSSTVLDRTASATPVTALDRTASATPGLSTFSEEHDVCDNGSEPSETSEPQEVDLLISEPLEAGVLKSLPSLNTVVRRESMKALYAGRGLAGGYLRASSRTKLAVSLVFSATTQHADEAWAKHEEEEVRHRNALFAESDFFADLAPNLAEILKNGQEPFYSSEVTTSTRHKIGGPAAADAQVLLNPGGVDDVEDVTDLDLWDVYPRGQCLDGTAREKCRSWLPIGRCLSSAPQGSAFSPRGSLSGLAKQSVPERRRGPPAWPATRAKARAQKPPSNAKRRSMARKEATFDPTEALSAVAQDHPLLMNASKLPALDVGVSSTSDKYDSWGLGLM